MSGILDRQTHPDLDTWRNLLRRSLKVMDDVRRQGHRRGIRTLSMGTSRARSRYAGHQARRHRALFRQ